jgi:hypothetical protein
MSSIWIMKSASTECCVWVCVHSLWWSSWYNVASFLADDLSTVRHLVPLLLLRELYAGRPSRWLGGDHSITGRHRVVSCCSVVMCYLHCLVGPSSVVEGSGMHVDCGAVLVSRARTWPGPALLRRIVFRLLGRHARRHVVPCRHDNFFTRPKHGTAARFRTVSTQVRFSRYYYWWSCENTTLLRYEWPLSQFRTCKIDFVIYLYDSSYIRLYNVYNEWY